MVHAQRSRWLMAIGGLIAMNAHASELSLLRLGEYRTGLFGQGAAEISAYDAASHRLFISNAVANTIDILDVSNPTAPSLVSSIDLSPYGGGVNSVAADRGRIAVAVENADRTLPGKAVFFDANGIFQSAVQVGSLPDMLTFTPDGRFVLVANEGEPNNAYTVDPEGSISLITLPSDLRRLTQAQVRTADFRGFNASIPAGVRIFGPGATPAQDLEPEYITVSPDSRTAWITLQENNAIAELDLRTARITAIYPLGSKDHSGRPRLTTHTLPDPVLGTTAAGDILRLGGFSGLFFEGWKGNQMVFVTHSDRGPNAEPLDLNQDGVAERPFPLPKFQPELIRFAVDPQRGSVQILQRIGLTRQDGKPLTGLPNVAGQDGLALADEVPVDLRGQPLPLDPWGADLEGVVRTPDGHYWMGDEYRPSLYEFDARGRLVNRYIPIGAGAAGAGGTEALPAVYNQRRVNRGFEAVAYADGKIYAFLQSPLDNPDVSNDASSKASRNVRIVAFDMATRRVAGEYLYVLEGGSSDKIGDAVAVGKGRFLLIERDSATGTGAKKAIYRIDLNAATDLSGLAPGIVGPGGSLEGMNAAALQTAGIQPVRKELYLDLVAAGYTFAEKAEGLALVDAETLAVINDNDFGLSGAFDPATGKLVPNPSPQASTLALIRREPGGLDASDRDGRINIRPWPVKGLYQPDTIAAYRVGGRVYLVTANEGDARDYAGFSEEVRVSSLTLDPTAFPNAAALKTDQALNRLRVTKTLGNPDQDGDYDELYTFGGRSFSIWTSQGQRVYDSGDIIETELAARLPKVFNSNNDANNSFDTRSDDKGPEPEGLAIGEIGGRQYAFVGLERIGGIMMFDISSPFAVSFAGYVNDRNFAGNPATDGAGDLGPEGVLFIPARESPNGQALLVVTHEISGSTVIYQVSAAPALP
ncbi:MAG TPA: choice-of-anchor I family protein [Candidatus Macondimonas sp.]|nr:choice-of-anchor I family protein [Candidatus Macondimonas sp.]